MAKNSIIFYRDWADMLLRLPEQMRHKAVDAILAYISNGEEPTDPEVAYGVFMAIRAHIERDANKYDQVCKKRAESGRRGGIKKAKNLSNVTKSKQDLANVAIATKSKQNKQDLANVADNDNDNENDNDITNNIKINNNNINIIAPKKIFKPPTIAEVKDYIATKEYTIDAEAFIAYYDSNGWMVGRHKMKNWKAALVTWQKRNQNERINNNRTTAQQDRDKAFANHIFNKIAGSGSGG